MLQIPFQEARHDIWKTLAFPTTKMSKISDAMKKAIVFLQIRSFMRIVTNITFPTRNINTITVIEQVIKRSCLKIFSVFPASRSTFFWQKSFRDQACPHTGLQKPPQNQPKLVKQRYLDCRNLTLCPGKTPLTFYFCFQSWQPWNESRPRWVFDHPIRLLSTPSPHSSCCTWQSVRHDNTSVDTVSDFTLCNNFLNPRLPNFPVFSFSLFSFFSIP